MKLKYCVLGAGLMGKAIAYDLLRQKDTSLVLLVDKNTKALKEARSFLKDNKKLKTKNLDTNDFKEVVKTLRKVDGAVAAMHYELNLDLSKAAIEAGINLCDLGGNCDVVDQQLKLNSKAKKAGVSIIPDCGLAPGMVAVLVKWGLEKFNWIDTVKIRVGGLPVNPKNKLRYERLFSVDGLINEYIEPVRVLRNGRIEIIDPLIEIEEIEFPKPFGKLEAFTTSGGTSTLIETYKSRLKNLDYKTIRYKGHCSELKILQKEGLFTHEYFEKNLPLCTEDVTFVKIIFEGNHKKHELTIIDKAKPPFTAMMRTTAFPAAIISQMQAHKQTSELGVKPQEQCIPANLFISELLKRKISIQGI